MGYDLSQPQADGERSQVEVKEGIARSPGLESGADFAVKDLTQRQPTVVTDEYRGISRALSVLTALNKVNAAKVTDLSRATGISRPALYRILSVLVNDGYVRRRDDDRSYAATSKVKTLSDGLRNDTSIYEIAAPILNALQREVIWPTDLAVYRGDRLELLETTRRQSPFVIDDLVAGRALSSILTTALGLAFLSAARPAERDTIVARVLAEQELTSEEAKVEASRIGAMLHLVVQRGFAWRYRGSVKETGTIAVPILHDGFAVASIGITFIAAAMSVSEAATRYLTLLQRAAQEIESALNPASSTSSFNHQCSSTMHQS